MNYKLNDMSEFQSPIWTPFLYTVMNILKYSNFHVNWLPALQRFPASNERKLHCSGIIFNKLVYNNTLVLIRFGSRTVIRKFSEKSQFVPIAVLIWLCLTNSYISFLPLTYYDFNSSLLFCKLIWYCIHPVL